MIFGCSANFLGVRRLFFGVRRLDAALVSGGLTPKLVVHRMVRIETALWALYLISTYRSGVKPPQTKAASRRRRPKRRQAAALHKCRRTPNRAERPGRPGQSNFVFPALPLLITHSSSCVGFLYMTSIHLFSNRPPCRSKRDYDSWRGNLNANVFLHKKSRTGPAT